jgi:hypothetical protein
MNFNDYLFRSHRSGTIMTNDRSGKGMGETCKKYLRQLALELKYGRKKEFTNKYIQKGLEVEESAITLYSRLYKKYYKKNDQRLTNEYLTGEPDIIRPEYGVDVKASWDLFTLPFADDKINPDYYWQGQAYMALTGLNHWIIAYCLVDTPLMLIEDEKRKLMYKMGALTNESPDYLEACEKIERAMTFGDIPIKERVVEFHIKRDDAAIENLYKRIAECREYLDGLFPDESDPRESLAAEHAILHTPI